MVLIEIVKDQNLLLQVFRVAVQVQEVVVLVLRLNDTNLFNEFLNNVRLYLIFIYILIIIIIYYNIDILFIEWIYWVILVGVGKVFDFLLIKNKE